MTRYAVDKILWTYGRDPQYRTAFNHDAASVIAQDELEDGERSALVAKDLRAIFSLGAHPFLVYSFAIQLNGGWSYQFMLDYVERLKGLELGDIET
jgi:protocatechuate 4,5-dioxygenase alpha chain